MAELRIPREEERKQLEEIYQCVGKQCKYVEALLSVSYSMFQSQVTPRIRCTYGNYFLFEDSKICENFCRNENKL